jgi:double-stranded uracil-DNA glycosylase
MAKITRADLEAAANKRVNEILAPNLRVLFCGINPSLYSAYTGYNFARPGNRFWPTLYASGFTDRLLAPSESKKLLDYGLGIANLVARPTATADELTTDELREGGNLLLEKIEKFRPQVLAMLGITAYRTAFQRPRTIMGRQPEPLGSALLWVLPNPSGLNAHYTPADLARVFHEFRLEIERLPGSFTASS